MSIEGRQFNMPLTEKNQRPEAEKSAEGPEYNQEKVLSPDEIGNIKKYANDFFNNYLRKPENLNADEHDHDGWMKVKDGLKKIIGSNVDDGLITHNLRQAAAIFINELLQFCETNKDNQYFSRFTDLIRRDLFSGTPNITGYLNLKDDFNLTAKFTSLPDAPQVQTVIGGAMVQDLTYSLQRLNKGEEEENFLSDFNKNTPAEKLDKLHLLELLGAQAAASGQYKAKQNLKHLLGQIKKESANAFINIALELTDQRLKQEQDQPTRSVFYFPDDPGNARLWDNLSPQDLKEAEKLNRMVYPDSPLNKGETMQKIANDLLAVLDHSNRAIKFAPANLSDKVERSEHEAPISLLDLNNTINSLQVFKKNKQKASRSLPNFIANSYSRIFMPLNKAGGNDRNITAINNLSEKIKPDEWQQFIELNDMIAKQDNEFKIRQGTKIKVAEEKNEQFSNEFIKYFTANAPSILKLHPDDSLKHYYVEFKRGLEEQDYDYAQKEIDDFYKVLKIRLGVSDIFEGLNIKQPKINIDEKTQKFIKQYDDLISFHKNNWQECQKEIKNLAAENFRKYKNEITRLEELDELIISDQQNIVSNLEKELITIKKELEPKLIKVDFTNLGQLLEKIAPALAQKHKPQNVELLFQHLYRPKMREAIEDKLGISLKELPFRYHIHLLEFLSEKTAADAEKVYQFVGQGQDSDAKNNRVKTFLSLDLNQDMGEKILGIGESLKNQPPQVADNLFGEYARLAEEVEKTAAQVDELYDKIFVMKEVNREEIAKIALKKAAGLLSDASDELKKTDEADKEARVHELRDDLLRQEITRKRTVEELAGLTAKLNQKCEKLDFMFLHGYMSDEKYALTKQLQKEREKKIVENSNPEFQASYQKWGQKIHIYDSNRIVEMIKIYGGRLERTRSDLKKLEMNNKTNSLAEKTKDSLLEAENGDSLILRELRILLTLRDSVEKKIEAIIYEKEPDRADKKPYRALSEAILNKYIELTGLLTKNKKELAELFKNKVEIKETDLSAITENIFKKAKECLDNFTACVERGADINEEEIFHELEEYQGNMILTAATYKYLAKDKEFNIEDLRGVTTEKLTAGQLTGDKKIVEKVEKIIAGRPEWPTIHGSALRGMVKEYAQLSEDKDVEAAEQIIEMAHIYYDNYADNPALQKKLVKGFLQALKTGGDDVIIYIIKKNGKIMTFDRFDKIAEGKKYFSSFNVRPAIHGSAVGDALMKISLRPEARDNELEADCDPNKSISQKYIEDEGFVGRGINDYSGTAMTLNIYNKKDNNRYYYRQPGLNKAAVMADYEKTAQEAGQADKFVLKFKTGSSQLFNAIDEYVNQNGYALTRYFFAGTGNREVYCAFEKPSGDKGGN